MTKQRTTINYFPHHCEHGRVLYILEKYWGNDGYAVFYKLLEQLGNTSGHYLDFRKKDRWEYFLAITLISEGFVTGILDKMAEMELIDKCLWEKKVVWAQFFVDSLKEVYARRTSSLPVKPLIDDIDPTEPVIPGTTIPLNGKDVDIFPTQLPLSPGSKVKYSKEEKKERKKERKDYSLSFLDFYNLYPKKEAKYEAYISWEKLKPNNGLVEEITTSLKKQIHQKKKLLEAKEFCAEWPYPATWLNQRRWEDVVPQGGILPKATASAHILCPYCKREVLKSDLEGSGCLKCNGGRDAVDRQRADRA